MSFDEDETVATVITRTGSTSNTTEPVSTEERRESGKNFIF